jgi:hypothetical protein
VSAFAIGDRVRVLDSWFVTHLRGAHGTVVQAPDGLLPHSKSGVFWVEFDQPWPFEDPFHPTEAAEIGAAFLCLVASQA